MKKSGFTLAEVLITLAIIGVVAALTIPAVVRNYQKTQTVTQLKKVYSALSNTTNLAIANEGPTSGWEVGENATGQAAIDFANRYLIPYLKVQKNCETKTTDDCAFKWKHLDTGSGSLDSHYGRFYLTDGTLIAVFVQNNSTDKRINVYIDLNGQKTPNTFGKDIFYYNYYVVHGSPNVMGKFMPEWYTADREFLINNTPSGCNRNANGRLCTALIMKDGWQMKDDYPWD